MLLSPASRAGRKRSTAQIISPTMSLGYKNKIINGNFQIWQRNTGRSTSGYAADRWLVNNGGSTFVSSQQTFTVGQTAVPYEPRYWHRTVVTSVAGVGNYCLQATYIEDVRTLAGQTATLSFYAKADASKNIAIEFSQNFGTGGTPSAAVTAIGVTTCALTTAWAKYTVTVTLPLISGKTLGTTDFTSCLQLNFWMDAGSTYSARTNSLGQQSGTFDIAQVQLEAGSTATVFEQRPIGLELSLCQRYYFDYGPGTTVRYILSVDSSNPARRLTIQFPQKMRVVPTTVLSITSSGSLTGAAVEYLTTQATGIIGDLTTVAGYSYVTSFTADADF